MLRAIVGSECLSNGLTKAKGVEGSSDDRTLYDGSTEINESILERRKRMI